MGDGRIAQEGMPYRTDAAIGDPRVDNQAWLSQHGLTAFAGLPLIAHDRVVGVLALFSDQPLPAAVWDRLAFVADRISGGIERHQERAGRRIVDRRTLMALQVANVGVWELDLASGVFWWSDELFTQFGVPRESFGGTWEAFVDLIHPDDRAAVIAARQHSDKQGSEFAIVHRVIRPDGNVRWLRAIGRLSADPDGHPVRAVGISLDVTDLHVLEAQFRQAQKMEAVGRLAGGVAHDFNNLLTAILGYSELLLADLGPDDPRRADVTGDSKAGTSAASLTRQLLAFSRKETRGAELLDLNVVVGEMRTMLERLIGEDIDAGPALGRRPR